MINVPLAPMERDTATLGSSRPKPFVPSRLSPAQILITTERDTRQSERRKRISRRLMRPLYFVNVSIDHRTPLGSGTPLNSFFPFLCVCSSVAVAFDKSSAAAITVFIAAILAPAKGEMFGTTCPREAYRLLLASFGG